MISLYQSKIYIQYWPVDTPGEHVKARQVGKWIVTCKCPLMRKLANLPKLHIVDDFGNLVPTPL